MDLSQVFSAGTFVHLALLCYVLGFLTRNELLLRLLVLVGTVFYILYYYFISDTPLWDAIWSSVVIGIANIWVVFLILIERTTIGMSPKMISLFEAFPTLNPGQFRKIMSSATWIDATHETQITKKGEELEHLFLVANGHAILRRDGVETTIAKSNFVGETSFLLGGPATADVVIPAGTEYVQWDKLALKKKMDKSPAISNALRALFNLDVARKLSKSRPVDSNLHNRNETISEMEAS